MSRLQSFRTRVSTSIAAEQPHRKTQISCVNVKPDRYQQPNVCVAPLPLLYLHSQLIKSKSVTDPLNEAVRARLCGNLPTTDMATHCSTSGSDQDADSERLAELIYGNDSVDQYKSHGDCSSNNVTEDCQVDAEGSNTGDFMALFREPFCEMLEDICSGTRTAFELCLLRNAEKAVAIAKGKAAFNTPENVEQKSRYRRFVMNSLRFAGYNAAVCKSRWEQTIRHPAGDYEFIDVVIEGSKLKTERFFVDIDFRAQFEIARPTDEYNALLQQLPTLFVGKTDKLLRVIKIMCDLARRSLKEREMCLPPWRKYRYMQFKWAGPYKRTTNPAGPRAAQGTCNEYGPLLQFPFSGIALKGREGDATVVHQMEKVNRAADRNLREKSNYTEHGNEQFKSPGRLLSRVDQDRHVKKISGLAMAFAEARLMPSSPSSIVS